MATFDKLLEQVVGSLCEITPRETIELGIVHGFCLDAAHASSPNLIPFIASTEGLTALSAKLFRLPDLVAAEDPHGASWRVIRQSERSEA